VILPLFVAIPLGGAFIISFLREKNKRIADFFATFTTFSLLLFSLYSIFLVKHSRVIVYKVGGWMPPIGICLVLDGLSVLMLVTVNIIAFLAVLYSISYMEGYTAKPKFYCLFLLMVAGINGVVVTGDFFNLFVFIEIASIASYALVAFGTEHEELEASFKYMVMGSLSSVFILLGIAFLYSYTSTLNMADMAQRLLEKGGGQVIFFATVLFIFGFGLKAAIVPFHAWLPDAHPSAPAPISAMLSGVLIKVLGVYALVRIFFNVLGVSTQILSILMVLGTVSIMAGVLLAIGQWDLKRLLAYHSISQIGYVILGLSLGTPLGILGGLFHLVNHSVFKSLLFLNSGAIVYSTGTRDLREMHGLRKQMPVTANTNLIASLSISGIPPFNGFWSKLIIIIACVQANRLGYAFWAVVGSILTLSSFMKVQKFAFFSKIKEGVKEIKEVPWPMKLSMITLSIICLVGGIILIPGVIQWFLEPAADVLLKAGSYASIVFKAVK